MSGTGRLVLSIGLAAALAAGLAARNARREVADARVRRSDIMMSADVTGVLRAVESVELGPPSMVRPSEFTLIRLAEEGSRVKQGDTVLVFDASERQAIVTARETELETLSKNIERKEAEYARRKRDAELELARADAELKRARMKLDVPADLVGSRELARARLDLTLAEEVVRSLQSRFEALEQVARADITSEHKLRDRTQNRLDDGRRIVESMTVRAPRDGTVIYRANDKGEKRHVGDTVWKQERIIELPDLAHMCAEGEVDEADSGRIALGQRVRLRLDAHADQEYRGQVEAIGSAVERPTTGSPVAVVRVRIALDSTDSIRMRPGMRFRGRIEIAHVAHALVIPTDAIEPSPLGPVAYRRTWRGYEPVAVVLGQRNGELFEVLGGLVEGERVALLHVARGGA